MLEGTVAGTVAAAANGEPVAWVAVSLIDSDSVVWGVGLSATPDGSYAASAPPGTYHLCFQQVDTGDGAPLADQCWNGTATGAAWSGDRSHPTGTAVTLTSGAR